MAGLHEGGGPQIGEETCGGSPHPSFKRDQIKMRNYMDRRVTQPKRVSSPTWRPPPPCKQALSHQPPILLQLSLGSFYISRLNTTLTCFNALFPISIIWWVANTAIGSRYVCTVCISVAVM